MVPEADIRRSEGGGAKPAGEGWFVLNAQDSVWVDGPFGTYTQFEGEPRFAQSGFNIAVLQPGQPACWYHRENEQENFLVLSGEALLLIEGQERPLRTWDFVHCPAWTEHVLIGAGDGPCTLLAVGTRLTQEVIYPVSELAQRHRAGVQAQTTDPRQAYSGMPDDQEVAFQPGWLPG